MDMTKDLTKYNPWAGNPFESRQDVAKAFEDLFEPLVPAFSKGAARVRVEQSAAFCDVDSADLEGFSRPIWGLVPFVAGGGEFKHWDLIHNGLKNGTDPNHEEYWGDPEDLEQRLVEFASIGVALAVIPDKFFDPIEDSAKPHIKDYFFRISECRYPLTNWKWFHILLTLGLKRIGAHYDHSITERNLNDMDEYYLSDGWYGDGPQKHAVDYYNPFAFHFYGLTYCKLCPEDTKRCQIYRDRATKFAKQFQHWFASDGAALPYGRSLTYKFATGSFWAAMVFAEEELLPWGVVKGYFLRHLRWWSKQPFSRVGSGLMSMGWAYPNPIMCERYNSPQSPYWGTKIFFPLALPESHPFWKAQEEPFNLETQIQPIQGMILSHYPNNTIALVSGPWQNGSYVRFQGEKYCKFAYSTRYGFSVEANDRSWDDCTLDNMIGFSEDGLGYRFRISSKSWINGDVLYSVWYPWKDVKVESWTIPKGQWHVRVHRINSSKDLDHVEGGFAISAVKPAKELVKEASDNSSHCSNGCDFSGIIGLIGERKGYANTPEPSTNIMAPKTIVPQLRGSVKANQTAVFACAVIANPDISIESGDWLKPPSAPSLEHLDALAKNAKPVLQ